MENKREDAEGRREGLRDKFESVPKPPPPGAIEESTATGELATQGTGSVTTDGSSIYSCDVLPGKVAPSSSTVVKALVPLARTSEAKQSPLRFQGHFAKKREQNQHQRVTRELTEREGMGT